MKRRTALIALAAIALVLAAQVIGYFLARNSDAFAIASKFVETDPKLALELGRVERTYLAPLDAEIRFSGGVGRAQFVVSTVTDRSDRKVLVKLEKLNDTWRVTEAYATQ